ncbi:MAG: 4Fe-4S dicluster domain-containing protein [Candidatus Sericytochromatia bacterium]|nr:4Fe-4S dicluster domain-containing protein [Candidatus Tanganyikabacteria bacterium]
MTTLSKLIQPLVAEGPYFKLVCGATFEDTSELAHLATIFTLAGARLVDVAAQPDAVDAALSGVRRARRLGSAWLPQAPVPLVMVSIGPEDDPHVQIAEKVDALCTWECPHCLNACPHGAIDAQLKIVAQRCVGCGQCVAACPEEAVRMVPAAPPAALDELWGAGARALELHAGTGAGLGAYEGQVRAWSAKGGVFSLSVNAVQMTVAQATDAWRTVSRWVEGPLLLQADGKPISGTAGEASTRPALSFACDLMAAGVPHVQVAGGTNDLTGKMAREMGLGLAGVAVGSFARRLVRDIRGLGDPNAGMSEGLSRARKLVASALEPLEAR